MKDLLCTPRVEYFESTMGFLLRLANENGFYGLTEFKAAVSSMVRCYDLRKLSRADLADLTGHNEMDMARWLSSYYEPINKNFFFYLGESDSPHIPRELINYRCPRICPQCLFEDGYIRHQWDFVLQAHCIKHNLVLQDQCPSCKAALNWGRPRLLKCHCGFSLSEFKIVRAPEDVSEFYRLMFEYRLGQDPRPLDWMNDWPGWFNCITTVEMSKGVIQFIYACLFDGGRVSKRPSEVGLRQEALVRGMSIIMTMMKKDPGFCIRSLGLLPKDANYPWHRSKVITEVSSRADENFVIKTKQK